MTPERWRRACAIFAAAVRCPAADRRVLLDEACVDDPGLRAEVERLLVDDAQAGRESFLDVPTASVRPEPRPAEDAGSRIGPYKLLQKLGEGGMGVVYQAEQDAPVRRRVAVKIIKPGMDNDQVIARFAAERQALALMDHPHIARVLDAGATDSGRPFFVMELVRGVPITEYCDQNKLTPKQRLELLIPVCRAIQHAHQKGIIHRDIKPSNVLVTLVDGQPVPKVIDFGVAKAIEQRLTERTIFTQVGAVVGTLEYMSPEQAESSALDIDTRSDVYSLGVLLYELLTGTTPLERSRLREAGYAEIVRRIREEEPPRPSTRLSDSGERLASIATSRGIEPARLSKLVRGELDWIAMRALEKDRTRRYETPGAMARDIECYLQGEAVEAGPPSARYRLGKLARRHRAALVTAGSFLLVLVAAAGGGTYLAVRAMRAEEATSQALEDTKQAKGKADDALALATAANHQKDAALKESEESRKQAEAVSDFLVEAFRKPDPTQDENKITVAELLGQAEKSLEGRFADSPRIRGKLLDALGQTYYGLGSIDKAVKLLERASSLLEQALGPDHEETLNGRSNLALAYARAGRADVAIKMDEETLKLRVAKLGPDHPDTLSSRNNLAEGYRLAGRFDDAIKMLEETLKACMAKLGPDHPETLRIRNSLTKVYHWAGRTDDAIKMGEETLKLRMAKIGPDHPDTLATRQNLALAYGRAGRTDDAIKLQEETVKVTEVRFGPDHPDTLISHNNLALAYVQAGRADVAIKIYERTLKAIEVKFGPDHPETLRIGQNLALAYKALARKDRDAGRQRLAIEPYRRALAIGEDMAHRDSRSLVSKEYLAWILIDFGMCLREAGLTDEAEARLRQSLEIWLGRIGETATVRRNHVDNLLWTLGELRQAAHVSRRFAAAVEDHRRAIAAAERLGEARPDVPGFAVLLAELHEGLGALLGECGPGDAAHPIRVKAASMRERATGLCESKLGPKHADTLACRDRLAEDDEALGRWADAERLRRETLSRREAGAPRGPSSAGDLIALGRDLLMQARHREAEAWLREGLALFGPGSAGDWEPYQAKSLLGGSLLGQGNYADAETPLIEGYEGMRAREARIPTAEKARLAEAAARTVALYEAWGKPEEAAAWRAKLPTDELPDDVFAH